MSKKRPALNWSLQEPHLLFMIFAGIGVGTLLLAQPMRLALLSTCLLLICLIYRGRRPVEMDFSLEKVGRGALLGLVISLPLLVFLAERLRVFAERMYATEDAIMLFYQVCLVSAPLEEYFFRGIIQPRLGPSAALAFYGIAVLIYFVFHVPILAGFILFVGMGLLGMLCGYVREQHGLAAAIACHMVVGLVLLVAPSIIHAARMMFG